MEKKYIKKDEQLVVHHASDVPPSATDVIDSIQVTLLALWLTLKIMKFYGTNMSYAEKEARRNQSISHCTEKIKVLIDLIYEKQYYKIPRTLYEVEISLMIRRYLDEEEFESCDYFLDNIPWELLEKTERDVWSF